MKKLICDYCKKPIEKPMGKNRREYVEATILASYWDNKLNEHHFWHFHKDCFDKMLKKDVMV